MKKRSSFTARQDAAKIAVLIISALIAVLLLIFPVSVSEFTSVNTESITYLRGRVSAVLAEDGMVQSEISSLITGRQTLEVRSGDKTYTVYNNLSDTHNVRVSVGSRIIIAADEPDNAEPYYTVYNYDRSLTIGVLLMVFVALMLAVGGKKGLFSAFALAFSVVLLMRYTIPSIYCGKPLMLTVIISVAAVTAVTTGLIDGFSLKGLVSALVTLIGEACACLIFLAMSGLLHISGFVSENVDSLLVIADGTGMEIKYILLACAAISSLGAVMDVSVSLVSAVWEIHRRSPSLSVSELFTSGMNVGRDMIGTMSNTLILAFAGSALATMLVFCSYGVQPEQLLNSDYLSCEIANGLSGTMAVILTVPIASCACCAVVPKLRGAKNKTTI